MAAETLNTHDADRVVAVHIDAPIGPLTLCGAVFPWRGDKERNIDAAVAGQVKEWAALRQRFPVRSLIVAGDLNTDLISTSHYLTMHAHANIDAALGENELFAATHTNRIPPAKLKEPPSITSCYPTNGKSDRRSWRRGKARLATHAYRITAG